MRHALVALAATAFVFVACNKVENSEIDQILAGKKGTKATTEAKGPTTGATANTTASSGPGLGWNDPLVKAVQEMVYWGNYDGAIDKVGSSTDLYLRYFAGVAYYGKMLSANRWSVSQRNEFQLKALSILKEVGNASRDELLAARSLLWAGMAIHLWHEDVAGNEEALTLLRSVADKYKDTEVLNDAILYMAKVNQKIGRYQEAKVLYTRLTSESFKDNQVYDPNLGRWFTPKDAGALGLQRIYQLTTPGWRPPQAQSAAPAATSAPAQNQTAAAAATPAASSSSTSSSTSASSTSTASSTSGTTTSSSSSTAPASSGSTSSTAPASSTSSSSSSTTTASSSTAPASSTGTTTTTSSSTSSTAPASTTTTSSNQAAPASSSSSSTAAPAASTSSSSSNTTTTSGSATNAAPASASASNTAPAGN